MWNWENFYPPSPLDSEFFNQRAQSKQFNHDKQSNHDDDFEEEVEEAGMETERSEYDFFNPLAQNQQHLKDEYTEMETVDCSRSHILHVRQPSSSQPPFAAATHSFRWRSDPATVKEAHCFCINEPPFLLLDDYHRFSSDAHKAADQELDAIVV